MSTLTDNTNTVPELLDLLQARLEGTSTAGWTLTQYHGTTAEGMLRCLLALSLPGAILYWTGEDANREPGRPQRIYDELHVMLLAEDALNLEGAVQVQAMLEEVKNLIDDYISGDTYWRYMHAEPVDLSDATQAPNVSAIDVTIEVGDH